MNIYYLCIEYIWAQPEYYHRGQHQSNRLPGCGHQPADRPAQTLQEGNQQPNLCAQGLQPPHACEEGIATNDWLENLGPILQQGHLRSRGRVESLLVQQQAPVHWEDCRQEEISEEKCDLVQLALVWWDQHQCHKEIPKNDRQTGALWRPLTSPNSTSDSPQTPSRRGSLETRPPSSTASMPTRWPSQATSGSWRMSRPPTINRVHPQPCAIIQQEGEDLSHLSDGEDTHLSGRPQDHTKQKELNSC